MTWINQHKGIVKRTRGNKVWVELPRGGRFEVEANRPYKVGEKVCFVFNSVTNKVLEIMPEKEAEEIAIIGQDETAHGVLIEDYEGIDLEDEDSGFEEENFDYLFDEEDLSDEHSSSDSRQISKGGFDFECGEPRKDVIDPADYFADADFMEVAYRPKD
jgi:hypothetical protein